MKKKLKKGFTLSEVLITFTIIGVVSAILLPSLTQSIDENIWNTKRKALHSRLSSAILSMPKVKGYGEYKQETINGQAITTDTQAESFIVNGLSKVYKIKNICDSNHIEKCGLPSTFTNLQGVSSKTFSKTAFSRSTIAIETENEEKIVVYYNASCRPYKPTDTSITPANAICANFIYDTNGTDGPNKVGRDIGVITVIYTPKGLETVAPNPYYESLGSATFYNEETDAVTLCKNKDEKFTLPSIGEGMSILYNTDLMGFTDNSGYLTGEIITPGKNGTVWYVTPGGGASSTLKTTSKKIICTKE